MKKFPDIKKEAYRKKHYEDNHEKCIKLKNEIKRLKKDKVVNKLDIETLKKNYKQFKKRLKSWK